jgi:hypothetical protein
MTPLPNLLPSLFRLKCRDWRSRVPLGKFYRQFRGVVRQDAAVSAVKVSFVPKLVGARGSKPVSIRHFYTDKRRCLR